MTRPGGRRTNIPELLQDLPAAALAEAEKVQGFIEQRGRHGTGLGWIDLHLSARPNCLSTRAAMRGKMPP